MVVHGNKLRAAFAHIDCHQGLLEALASLCDWDPAVSPPFISASDVFNILYPDIKSTQR